MITSNWRHLIGYIFGLIQSLSESLWLWLYENLCFNEVFFLFLFVIDKKGESGALLSLGNYDTQQQDYQQ